MHHHLDVNGKIFPLLVIYIDKQLCGMLYIIPKINWHENHMESFQMQINKNAELNN